MKVSELMLLLRECPEDAVVLLVDGYDQGMGLSEISVRDASDAYLKRLSFPQETREEITKANHVAILNQNGPDMEF
jgi:hypothetical protein